jgi:hypothetical protein
MANPPRGTDLRDPPLRPSTAGKGGWRRAVGPHQGRPAAGPARRLDRVTAGFWLGGAGLGAGGCLLGACLAEAHPAPVALTVLWSGLYWGCFGAILGAVFALCRRPAAAPPARASAGAGTHPSGADGPALPGGYHGPLSEGLP